MIGSRHIRKFLAVLFTAAYLFVALFSQHFHNHGSGEVFKDFQLKKTEKTFAKSDITSNFTDCLSCHILHGGKFLLPYEFSFSFKNLLDFKLQVFAYQQRFAKLEFFYLKLRGPPVYFI